MLKDIASARGLEPLMVCFDRHPLETIAPHRAPRLLQLPRERNQTLQSEGISLHILEFTAAMASLSAEEWLREMHDTLGVVALVVGYDNKFGSDGRNLSIDDYRRLGEKLGVEVFEAPYYPKAASSAIRALVAAGDMQRAAELLGRHYSIGGIVVQGKHMGSIIGFPTANLQTDNRILLPPVGVYSVDVRLPDGSWHRAVANIGLQPTLAVDAPLRLEIHIPGFSGNLYGEHLTVRFLSRLRGETKFPSPQALKTQISSDIVQSLNLII